MQRMEVARGCIALTAQFLRAMGCLLSLRCLAGTCHSGESEAGERMGILELQLEHVRATAWSMGLGVQWGSAPATLLQLELACPMIAGGENMEGLEDGKSEEVARCWVATTVPFHVGV